MLRLSVYFTFRRIPRRLLALLMVSFRWLFHVAVVLRVIPRCLCSIDNSKGMVSNVRLGEDGMFRREIKIVWVLSLLNFTDHVFAQSSILFKSR